MVLTTFVEAFFKLILIYIYILKISNLFCQSVGLINIF
jgi:uncharacterized protein YqhQ